VAYSEVPSVFVPDDHQGKLRNLKHELTSSRPSFGQLAFKYSGIPSSFGMRAVSMVNEFLRAIRQRTIGYNSWFAALFSDYIRNYAY
jgi:hypothetical protein